MILVENIFRNFQAALPDRQGLLQQLAEGRFGADPTHPPHDNRSAWTDRLRLILASALQVDKAIFFSALITVAAFVPLFTMQGVEGQIFNPMARTYGLALAGRIAVDIHRSRRCWHPICSPSTWRKRRPLSCGLARNLLTDAALVADHRKTMVAIAVVFLAVIAVLSTRLGSEFLPALEEGNLWIRASMPPTIGLEAGSPATRRCARFCSAIPRCFTSFLSMAGRTMAATLRRSPMSSCSCH